MSTTARDSDTTSRSGETHAAEQSLVLHDIGWDQYEKVLETFQEHPSLRVTYVDRRLSLVSPNSRRHDWYADRLGMLVEAIATRLGIEWEPAGHSTYRREDLEAGVEGDQTFYFGDHSVMMRGPVDVDLSSQPPPDLAVEVELSHRSDDSVEVWRRLGAPEVWRLDVKRGTLVFLVRQPDESFRPSERGRVFAMLAPADVLAQLELAKRVGSSAWTRQLADWVRDTLAPRRGE